MFISCSRNERLEYALDSAGENRAELEKVLKYYKDDKLKYKAACFLIENMPYYFSYEGAILDSVKAAKATADKRGKIHPSVIKKWNGFDKNMLVKKQDCHVITGDYLISNIEHAFKKWKSCSWNKNLSFEEFCEFLLPYRIGDEPLDDWRELYEQKFASLLDIVPDKKNVVAMTDTVIGYLQKEGFIQNNDFNLPHLGAAFLLEKRVGKCQDACDFMIYVLRSLGIPVGVDYYAYCPETRTGHTWNVVREPDGHYASFTFPERMAEKGKAYIDGRKIGKIYRKCFGRQDIVSEDILMNKEIPLFFRDDFRQDVTGNYYTCSLQFELPKIKDKYVYLGLFGKQEWRGVAQTEVKNGKAVFMNVQPQCIYSLLIYKDKHYKLVDYPFYYDGKKCISFIPDMECRETIALYRKYPLFRWIRWYMEHMLYSKFQVSDSETFKSRKTIYEITDSLKVSYNEVLLDVPVRGRYVRHLSSDSVFAELAEVHFYSGDMEHKPLACYGEEPAFIGTEPLLTYDNDPLTYFSSNKLGGAVVWDLGKTVSIDRFSFMPHNDDNFIRIGDTYELFYQGLESLVSLGIQKATGPQLIYENVPCGALLYLHNVTRGVEEGAFYMKDGKQVFVAGLEKDENEL